MDESQQISVLAIDGGGSRCRVAAERAGHIHVAETGAANASSDLEGAVAQIKAGLAQLAAQMDIAEGALSCAPAYVGLAGVISTALAERLRAALPFPRALIQDDRPAAVRGALGLKDGAIIHCGTGSFFALQSAGRIRLAGGWGGVLDDVASAKWIGASALSATLWATDGMRPASPLSASLLHQMGGAEAIVAFAARATPAEFGALAPRVRDAAGAGDAMGVAILQDGARYVSETIRALGWSEGMALCLTGGVAPSCGPYLPEKLAHALCDPLGEPLQGALSLARDFAQAGAP